MMRKLRAGRVLAILVSVLVMIGATPATARPPDGRPSHHDEVVAYWTAERVRNAVPRDFVLDELPEHAVPLGKPSNPGGGKGKGGNGGGDDGGSSGAVNGASWTDGGTVAETTGKVLFTLGGTDYVCSGSVVATAGEASLVLTAAHCLYDEGGTGFASYWLFVPNFDGGDGSFSCPATPHGCWTASALVTTTSWAQQGDFNYDVGFAVMNPGGHSGTANLSSTVDDQAIDFNQATGQETYAFGYPHAKPYDGTDLTYCAGVTTDDPYSFDEGLTCKMTGGSSGGPWLAGFEPTDGTGTLSSVNSFKYRFDKKTMYGPYFGNYAAATYSAAVGATGNTLVSPPASLP